MLGISAICGGELKVGAILVQGSDLTSHLCLSVARPPPQRDEPLPILERF